MPIAPNSVTNTPMPISQRAERRVGALLGPRSTRGATTLTMSPNSQRPSPRMALRSVIPAAVLDQAGAVRPSLEARRRPRCRSRARGATARAPIKHLVLALGLDALEHDRADLRHAELGLLRLALAFAAVDAGDPDDGGRVAVSLV